MTLSKPLIFFDLETTGVSTNKDRIVQIACIKVKVDGTGRDEKVLLINPEMPIPPSATAVHGITDEMVKDAPTFRQVAVGIKKFFTDCDIAGYNSNQFDLPLLATEFERVGVPFMDWVYSLIDVMVIERKVNSHKLTDAYERYTGEKLTDAHDALADAKATETVLIAQLEKYFSTQEIEVTPELLDEFTQGDNKRFDIAGKCYIKDHKVYWAFGKNKDKEVQESLSYLQWVMSTDFPAETKNKLNSYIN
tara:strand:- start:10854 stop:11600 length:747 start_codon:yes stop_codon:yes gene_type:complete